MSSSEDISAKTKSVIELKKLQLLQLQRRLRRYVKATLQIFKLNFAINIELKLFCSPLKCFYNPDIFSISYFC